MSGDKGLGRFVGSKVNLHFLLLAEFLAEAFHGSSNTHILQFCPNAIRAIRIEYR